MLRITIRDEAGSLTFQLEGKLVGPWVQEVVSCWQSTQAGQPRRALRFDVTGVTSIDAAGKAFLAAMHAQGAEFLVRGCLMQAIVAEITDTSALPGAKRLPQARQT